jgi:biopolymer transport protein ExbD
MGGVQETGKGSKKSLGVELNLVPYIDLMIVLITFLLLTAVWTQTGRINVDQSVQKPQKQEQTEPPKRLTILVDQQGYTVRYADGRPEPIPMVSAGTYNVDGLQKWLKDQEVDLKQKIVVAPADSVTYQDMITAMDACMRLELMNIVVADAASVANEMM